MQKAQTHFHLLLLAGSVIRFLWTKECSRCYCYVFLNWLAPVFLTALFYLINHQHRHTYTFDAITFVHVPVCVNVEVIFCVHETRGAVFVWRAFLLRVWHVKRRCMLRCFRVLCVWCWWLNNILFFVLHLFVHVYKQLLSASVTVCT